MYTTKTMTTTMRARFGRCIILLLGLSGLEVSAFVPNPQTNGPHQCCRMTTMTKKTIASSWSATTTRESAWHPFRRSITTTRRHDMTFASSSLSLSKEPFSGEEPSKLVEACSLLPQSRLARLLGAVFLGRFWVKRVVQQRHQYAEDTASTTRRSRWRQSLACLCVAALLAFLSPKTMTSGSDHFSSNQAWIATSRPSSLQQLHYYPYSVATVPVPTAKTFTLNWKRQTPAPPTKSPVVSSQSGVAKKTKTALLAVAAGAGTLLGVSLGKKFGATNDSQDTETGFRVIDSTTSSALSSVNVTDATSPLPLEISAVVATAAATAAAAVTEESEDTTKPQHLFFKRSLEEATMTSQDSTLQSHRAAQKEEMETTDYDTTAAPISATALALLEAESSALVKTTESSITATTATDNDSMTNAISSSSTALMAEDKTEVEAMTISEPASTADAPTATLPTPSVAAAAAVADTAALASKPIAVWNSTGLSLGLQRTGKEAPKTVVKKAEPIVTTIPGKGNSIKWDPTDSTFRPFFARKEMVLPSLGGKKAVESASTTNHMSKRETVKQFVNKLTGHNTHEQNQTFPAPSSSATIATVEVDSSLASATTIDSPSVVEEALTPAPIYNDDQQQQPKQLNKTEQKKKKAKYIVKTRSPVEEQELAAKYASMPLEERAYQILLDLGMVEPYDLLDQ